MTVAGQSTQFDGQPKSGPERTHPSVTATATRKTHGEPTKLGAREARRQRAPDSRAGQREALLLLSREC